MKTSIKNIFDSMNIHLNNHNATNLNLLARFGIKQKIYSGNKICIQRHDELVDKNRYALDEMLKCIICYGKYELSFRGHDE